MTPPCRKVLRILPILSVVVAALGPVHVVGQEGGEITAELLRDVMPAAERFSAKEGDPPVFRGFAVDPSSGSEALVGYVLLTSDLPPEPVGFNGPVRVLVGMDLEGRLTGIRVIEYWESLRSSRGDFLRRPGFQSSFSGKHVTEPFRVRRDVDAITGATITVAAMAAGIRNAARRVAIAYLTGSGPPGDAEPESYIGTISEDELSRLSWLEMLSRGLAEQVVSMERGFATLFVSLAYLRDEAVADILLGPANSQDVRDWYAKASAEGGHLMMLGVDGSGPYGFRPQSVFFVQEDDTVWVSPEHFFEVGAAAGGTVEGRFDRVGLLLVERALDVTRPFTIMLEPGRAFPEVNGRRPNLGQFSSDEYVVEAVAVAPALVTEDSSGERRSRGTRGRYGGPGDRRGILTGVRSAHGPRGCRRSFPRPDCPDTSNADCPRQRFRAVRLLVRGGRRDVALKDSGGDLMGSRGPSPPTPGPRELGLFHQE